MTSPFNNLKKIKRYIGSLIIFSFILQSTTPIIAAVHASKLSQKQSKKTISSTKANNFVADSNLNKIIRLIVEEANTNISDSVKRCYKTLMQGTQVLPTDDVWQAMPEILQYVVDYHTKAPRPNAPITESNAIVGPGGCDTAQLLELLITIKNKIGFVTDDVCCNTILGVLGNACEIFGPDDSISSILLEILNLIQTRTACCDFPQTWTILATIEQDIQDTFTALEHLQETLTACCEAIREDIFDTLTILTEEINSLTASPCAPTPIMGPTTITESGTYCLAQDITGTIIVATSNVSIDLNSHQITATSPGIQIQGGLYNVSIFNGTITGTAGSTGIEAADSTDIEINDINFIIDGIGITFNNIQNFIINNTQFTNYTNSAMSLTNSQNGRITNSQIRTNNSTDLILDLTLITLDGCQQLVFNNIVMTTNTNIALLRGISSINTHECTFENIQITSNEVTQSFEGIRLENCDNNIIKLCTVNQNSISSFTSPTSFAGITVTASIDNGSKNNSITECQVHDNSNITLGVASPAAFVGINIAGIIAGGTINNGACPNTTISNSSVINNSCTTGTTGSSFFIGINIAGIISGGTIGNDVCANCTVTNCTVTNNTMGNSGATTQFIGINFAGIFDDTTSTGTIGTNACKNCHAISCDVSSNNASSTGVGSTVVLICINFGGNASLNLANTINDNACASCSVSDCSLNNNSTSSTDATLTVFVGVSLASTIGSTIGNNGCASCSISNCTVDNNSNAGPNQTVFRGYSLAQNTNGGDLGTNICESCSIRNCTVNNNITSSTSSVGRFTGIACSSGGNNCNNCIIDTITVYQNNVTLGSFFFGIDLFGLAATTSDGGCNNITCSSCLIEGNTLPLGQFHGISMVGIGAGGFSGGCNNITLKSCEVHNNSTSGSASDAYGIDGTASTGPGGANNIQFENCTAKQNVSNVPFHGFFALNIANATWSNCISIANSTDGFLVQDTTNSSLQECQAHNNGESGFNFGGTTQQVTITDSQALGNLNDGFSFAITTTQCHIRNNIAQNSTNIGFNNVGGDLFKHQFFGNSAQGNGTNYSGIDLVTSPNLTTGSLANAET